MWPKLIDLRVSKPVEPPRVQSVARSRPRLKGVIELEESFLLAHSLLTTTPPQQVTQTMGDALRFDDQVAIVTGMCGVGHSVRI